MSSLINLIRLTLHAHMDGFGIGKIYMARVKHMPSFVKDGSAIQLRTRKQLKELTRIILSVPVAAKIWGDVYSSRRP